MATSAGPLPAVRGAPLQLPSLRGFLDRVRENNSNLEAVSTLTPFWVGGTAVGKLRPECVVREGQR